MTKDDIAKLPTPRTEAVALATYPWMLSPNHDAIISFRKMAVHAQRLERENAAMRNAFVHIGEYWNGGNSVDVAEECQQCADATLAAIRKYEEQA